MNQRFLNQLEKITRNKNLIVTKPTNYNNRNKYTHLKVSTPNKRTYLIIGVNNRGNFINYVYGKTAKNKRGKGFGTLLRSIPILAAKNTKYKTIYHTGMFNNESQRSNRPPPSSRIVKKLGFNVNNNMGNVVMSSLNLSRANYNHIKKIIYS